jgi:hypothetical protein
VEEEGKKGKDRTWVEETDRSPEPARERNAEKAAKQAAKGSQLDTNKKAMTIQCKTCMETFMCTTSEVKCKEHAEAKHPKVDLGICFPHLLKK